MFTSYEHTHFLPLQECTGSICLAYGLESCQCAQGPDDPETKACELCCKEPGDAEGKTCKSSFQVSLLIKESSQTLSYSELVLLPCS